jgi:3-hydroxyacyl-CoA dehydrogenase/3a,7a,12a-trihydroxy-5b-cholest-24-enoyl-CoA hydratase
MSELRFDGKVVVITGAGSGLGKCYAHFFSNRGAKILANDVGCDIRGVGADTSSADTIVAEIRKAGGEATANYDLVEHGDRIIQAAVDAYGTVDILVNNAGILRDVSLNKMIEADWDKVIATHLKGTFMTCKAVWNIFRAKSEGKIINTTSGAGLFGAFGQSNYSAAKLAIHGFTMALAKEGESKNIHVNTIAPIAGSRMTETVLSPELIEALSAKYVAPLVAYLAHESCEETGGVFEVGAGYIAKLRWQRTEGKAFDFDKITPESIAENWEEITSFERENDYPEALTDTLFHMMNNFERNSTSGEETKSAEVFDMMIEYLARGEGADLSDKVGAIFQFDVKAKKGGPIVGSWEIDLKNTPPSCKVGKSSAPDATFTMVDEDFEKVCLGTLNPQMAFMQGKMKIKGNLGKATKFTPDLFPPPTPENVIKYTKAKL